MLDKLGIKLSVDESSINKINSKETSTKETKSSASSEASGILKGLGKIAVAIGGLLALYQGLEPILRPAMQLIKVIMTLLFLPLIPILKPVLNWLGKMAKDLAPIMTNIAKKVEDAFNEGGLGGAIAVLIEEMIDAILPMIPDLINTFIEVFEAILPYLPQIIQSIIDGLIQAMELLIPYLPQIVDILLDGFFVLMNAILERTPEIIEALFDGVVKIVEGLVEIIQELWTNHLKEFIIALLFGVLVAILVVVGGLTVGWAVALGALIVGLVLWLVTYLQEKIPEWIDKLKEFGQWIWDEATKILTSSLKVLSGIGSWIKNKVMGFFSFGGGGKSVDDAIISPSGDIITTDPADYIIATKNPAGLVGQGTTINIKVDGFVGDEETLANKIGKALASSSRGGLVSF